MQKFVARQPIFDREQKIYAYELLFRSGMENFFSATDADQASSSVISDGTLLHDLNSLTDGHWAFINCTREILLQGYPTMLPKDLAVVEILETVEPKPDVLAAVQELKDKGYRLALDDVTFDDRSSPFLDLVDIIKVDMPVTTPEQRKKLVEMYAPRGKVLLAEKVETQEEFREVCDAGFHYFQGYFFSKPEIITSRDIPAFKLNYLRVLRAVNRLDLDLDELESIIKSEASLAYKLLRYLNSAFFGFRKEITSIRHALALLGEREIKTWASLLALAGMAEDKPDELVVNSMIHAALCESVAERIGQQRRQSDFFLVGLLAKVDAILDQPMESILAKMPINEDMKAALLPGEKNSRQNIFANVLNLVRAYQNGDWEELSYQAEVVHIPETLLPLMYMKAVEWAHHVFKVS